MLRKFLVAALLFVGLPCFAATDNFEGAPGTDLPDYGPWLTSAGGVTTEISNDGHSFQATVIDGTPNANYRDAVVADKHFSRGTINVAGGGDSGVTIRQQTATKDLWYAIYVTALGEVFVGEYIAGAVTDWPGGSHIAGFADGDQLELAIDAAVSTTVHLNRIRLGVTTTIATFTGRTSLTGGKYGVCAFLGASALIQDWEGGDVALGAGVVVNPLSGKGGTAARPTLH